MMDNNVTAVANVLYRFYTRCTLQYGIDCADNSFLPACPSKMQLWTSCTAPPFSQNATQLTQSMRLFDDGDDDDNNAVEISNNSDNNPCYAAPRRCLEKHLFDLVIYDNIRLFYIYAPIAVFMCIVALATNAIGLAGLFRIRPKYPRHFILVSMSISDTLLSILTLLKKAGDVVSSDEWQHFFRRYLIVAWQTTFLASALMLLSLALEAFVALTATFVYESFSRRPLVVPLYIGLVWIISLMFPLILLFTGKSYDMTFQYAVSGLLMLIIGVTISSYLYAFLLAERARKEIRNQRRASQAKFDDGITTGRRKSLLTVCMLMTSSVVSWLPLNVYMMLGDRVERDFPFYNRLVHVFLIMFHLNAIINPLTYTLRMNAVRATLRRCLGVKEPSKSSRHLSSSTLPFSTTTNNNSHYCTGILRKSSNNASNQTAFVMKNTVDGSKMPRTGNSLSSIGNGNIIKEETGTNNNKMSTTVLPLSAATSDSPFLTPLCQMKARVLNKTGDCRNNNNDNYATPVDQSESSFYSLADAISKNLGQSSSSSAAIAVTNYYCLDFDNNTAAELIPLTGNDNK